MKNLIKQILREEILNKSKFFRRRVNLDKVRNLLQINAEQVYYETKNYEQFKYELTLRAVETIMWNIHKLGWEDLPEQEEIEFVNKVSNIFREDIKLIYDSLPVIKTYLQESIKRIVTEETSISSFLKRRIKFNDLDNIVDEFKVLNFREDLRITYSIKNTILSVLYEIMPEENSITDDNETYYKIWDELKLYLMDRYYDELYKYFERRKQQMGL